MNDRQTLPIKHRPRYLKDFLGSPTNIKTLENLLGREFSEVPASWLFHGPAGCGKTTLARILQNELDCSDLCFYEYNASNTRGIDTIREVQEASALSPMMGNVKIFFFDEAHMVTGAAQNAMLKLLEDPPENTFFILATTDPEKLIKPIHSRCTKIAVQKLSSRILIPFLKDICEKEGVDLPDGIFSEITKSCGGTPRDALKILDSIIDLETEEEMYEMIQAAYIDEESLFDFCKMLIDPKTKWDEIVPQIKLRKEEPENLRRGVLGILNSFLLNTKTEKEAAKIAAVMECFQENYYSSGSAGFSMSCLAAKLS